jgi:hypothetical protein
MLCVHPPLRLPQTIWILPETAPGKCEPTHAWYLPDMSMELHASMSWHKSRTDRKINKVWCRSDQSFQKKRGLDFAKPLETKGKPLSYPMLPDFRKSIGVWKVPRLRPFVLLVRAARRWWWWVRWMGGMLLQKETHSVSVTKSTQWTQYRKIRAVCPAMHTKHKNRLYVLNAQFHNVTTEL